MVAPVVGVCGLMPAAVPYPGVLAGIAAGVVGIGAGVVGVIAARRRAARWAAMSGIVVSVLAIAAGVALVFVHPNPATAGGGADRDTAEVLRNELDVVIGHFAPGDADSKRGRVPVTLTNRTAKTSEFAVAIAAFGADGHQIDCDTARVTLAARSSEDQDIFTFSPADRIQAATFRVIAVHKVTGWVR
ncbi:hypothetical protein BKN37_03615 [Mycobacterium talmoniae]|uniref:Uncharacterized protein n=1 Tax=Mycobacterium talmoniae TaxID=1858794 RepID=A0A1S1NJ18_9MYCO|nr:hypothetical protein BKN37_03615 [Mycobacterium talmoniae]